MSRTLLVTLGLAALAALGLALYLLTGASRPTEDEDAPRTRGANAPAARSSRVDDDRPRPKDLTGRVARLESDVESLRQELALLRKSGAALKSPLARVADPVDPEDPEFVGSVRDIIEADKAEERELATERRRDGFKTATDEALTRLREDAGVSAEASEQLATLWEREAETILPLIEQARAGERPFGEIRGELQAARQASDDAAKTMLSPEQFEAYEELRPGRRGPGGGRRGRGRD